MNRDPWHYLIEARYLVIYCTDVQRSVTAGVPCVPVRPVEKQVLEVLDHSAAADLTHNTHISIIDHRIISGF